MHSVSVAAALVALVLPLSGYAQDFSPSHTGSVDPLVEGFATLSFSESVSTGPVVNDLGIDAWEIISLTTMSQFAYVSGAFTAAEKSAIVTQGFTLSFTERVLQGSEVSVYSAATPYVLSMVGIDTGTRRYQVFLGLDASGDTVAVLPTSITANSPGARVQAPGASYTLTGQGNGYHDYQLVFDPATQLASLYIDSQLRLSDYGGYDNFLTNHGLGFGGYSGSAARFAEVELTLRAVPELPIYALMIPGLVVLFASRLRRRPESGPRRWGAL